MEKTIDLANYLVWDKNGVRKCTIKQKTRCPHI